MSDDKREEWHVEPTLKHELGSLVMEGNTPIAICPRAAIAVEIAADHNEVAAIRGKAALADELAGHLRYWLGAGWASTTRGVASHAALDRYDALSRDTGVDPDGLWKALNAAITPTRDTGSEEEGRR